MPIPGEKPDLNNAFERGKQSVRDGTEGNPYAPHTNLYEQFELGIEREQMRTGRHSTDQY